MRAILEKAIAESRSGKITRIEIKTEPVSVLQWLRAQPFAEKFYWRDRYGGEEIGGVGIADVQSDFETIRKRIGRSGSRYFGGVRFPTQEKGDAWRQFGSSRFVLPLFELIRRGEQCVLVCTIFEPENVLEKFETLRFSFPAFHLPLPKAASAEDEPGLETWKKNVSAVKKAIRNKEIGKVVLARKSELNFEQDLDPFSVAAELLAKENSCFHFLFKPDQKSVFLGASPELLFERNDRTIKSEAISGTRRRGQNAAEDAKLAQGLLDSKKEFEEHFFVRKMIEEKLQPLCESLNGVPVSSILKLAKVMHLINHFDGKLSSNVGDAEILRALHPTPAVGGAPSANALEMIEKIEAFDRGWYAGAVGWLGASSAQFAVAIRSALLTRRTLSLFAGAGIVAESHAQTEWEELNHKIQPFSALFGA